MTKKVEINIDVVEKHLTKHIKVFSIRHHGKASESYIETQYSDTTGVVWKGLIPYHYRRTGLFLEDEIEIAEYLNSLQEHFSQEKIELFKRQEQARWNKEHSNKATTKEFFDKLLSLDWMSVKDDLPNNPNWARRIQDIKEFGYTLATHTSMKHKTTQESSTHIRLLPIPKGGVTGYETMSPEFKAKCIKLLGGINAYEHKKTKKEGLIPDHKFSEIRWDEHTIESNEALSDDEIIQKFQLLDNQRNLQKREVCRKCFQTNERQTIYGIDYFYKGDKRWPLEVKVGKEAEKGCEGCGWYDISKWRESLNQTIKS